MRKIFAGCCASVDAQSAKSTALSAKPKMFFFIAFLTHFALRLMPIESLYPLSPARSVGTFRQVSLAAFRQINYRFKLHRLLEGRVQPVRRLLENLVEVKIPERTPGFTIC
jgi:hypothetical protein